jgi:hypothetical protein
LSDERISIGGARARARASMKSLRARAPRLHEAFYRKEMMLPPAVLLTASLKLRLIRPPYAPAQGWEASMKTTLAFLALLLSAGLPATADANEPAASFEARWPDAPMREPTLTEMVRLVASVAREDIRQAAQTAIAGSPRNSWRCTAEFCRLLKTP